MEIGITMLGTTGTGKTCYLYAMADKMANGVNKLTFSPTDFEVALELQDQWDGICDGVWPPPSDVSEEYRFTCAYSMRPLVDFRWYDYKGGLLSQRGDEVDQAERVKVLDRMNNSESLIVCVSSEHLKGLLEGDRAATRPFRAYAHLLQEFVRSNGHTIPVMFAVTKADLISKDQFEAGVEMLKTRFFSALFAEDGDWLVGFVPVSLGKNFETEGGRILGGSINPWNIEIPVLFCIKSRLDVMVPELEGMLKTCCRNREDAGVRLSRELAKSGWDRFWDGDNSGSIRTEVESLENKICEMTKKLNQMRRDIDNIASAILESGAKIYMNGYECIK